jgi:hypothetical protein
MSRRRINDDGESGWGALGEQLKNELRGVLQLLLRSARRTSVALLPSEVAWTTVQSNLFATAVSIPVHENEPRISPDAISRLHHAGQLRPSPLLSPASISLRSGPVFQASDGYSHALPLLQPSTEVLTCVPLSLSEQAPPKFWLPELPEHSVKTMALPIDSCQTQNYTGFARLKTVYRSLPLLLGKRFCAAFKSDARFKALPIQKSPIPLHRFSTPQRQAFRQALATKYSLSGDNIQLVRVFDRIAMRRYGNLDQDAQGHLLCTPKLAGASATTLMNPIEEAQSYLVIGLRLDTRQEVHALLPKSLLKEEERQTETTP